MSVCLSVCLCVTVVVCVYERLVFGSLTLEILTTKLTTSTTTTTHDHLSPRQAKEDDSILIAAVKHSADDVVSHLFNKFPEVMKKMVDEPNKRSQTALYWAVKKGSGDITR